MRKSHTLIIKQWGFGVLKPITSWQLLKPLQRRAALIIEEMGGAFWIGFHIRESTWSVKNRLPRWNGSKKKRD